MSAMSEGMRVSMSATMAVDVGTAAGATAETGVADAWVGGCFQGRWRNTISSRLISRSKCFKKA